MKNRNETFVIWGVKTGFFLKTGNVLFIAKLLCLGENC